MDLAYYFEAYTPEDKLTSKLNEGLIDCVDFYTQEFELKMEEYDICIMGVPEGRLAYKNETCAFAPDEIRSSLYELYRGDWGLKILDLGNLKVGHRVKDTYAVLEELVVEMLQAEKKIIVLGGGHDLIQPIYKAHASFGLPLNFASADAYLDFQDESNFHSKAFLSQLISEDSLLSKYQVLGYQSYLCSPSEVNLLSQMDFDLLRLGELSADVKELEPNLREVNHLSVDLSVVKSADAPACFHSSPNGISAENLCALTRYAGMGHNLQTVLFAELNPRLDRNNQSSKTYAQAIWYLLEGLHLVYNDFPDESLSNFQKYHVSSEFSELVFYKSKQSARWWVELPSRENLEQRKLLPCSLLDYNKAVAGQLSERLLKLFKF